jgi:hypothetical protein
MINMRTICDDGHKEVRGVIESGEIFSILR